MACILVDGVVQGTFTIKDLENLCVIYFLEKKNK